MFVEDDDSLRAGTVQALELEGFAVTAFQRRSRSPPAPEVSRMAAPRAHRSCSPRARCSLPLRPPCSPFLTKRPFAPRFHKFSRSRPPTSIAKIARAARRCGSRQEPLQPPSAAPSHPLATASGERPAPDPRSRPFIGVSRGYETFAKPASTPLNLKRIEMPDLASFRPREGVKEIALEAESITGRSPRTLEGAGEQAVDLGAGYRVSRNLNVTAGVRLSQERDRLAPLTDAVRDDQAVYVGTQFRF